MSDSSREIRSVQIEAGKQIVNDILRDLASRLKQPKIADLVFAKQNFDSDQIPLIESDTRAVVILLEGDDLADAPATPSKRSELIEHLTAAVIGYFGIR